VNKIKHKINPEKCVSTLLWAAASVLDLPALFDLWSRRQTISKMFVGGVSSKEKEGVLQRNDFSPRVNNYFFGPWPVCHFAQQLNMSISCPPVTHNCTWQPLKFFDFCPFFRFSNCVARQTATRQIIRSRKNCLKPKWKCYWENDKNSCWPNYIFFCLAKKLIKHTKIN